MGMGYAAVISLVLLAAGCSSSGTTPLTESVDTATIATSTSRDEDDAPAPPTDASTTVAPESETEAGELDGIWWKPTDPDLPLDFPITIQFGPGDLFVLDGRAQLTAPVFRGRHTFVDDVVTYADNEIVDGPCDDDRQNRWAVTTVDDGKIDTEVLESGVCGGGVGTSRTMLRLSPTSSAGAAITAPDGEFDDTLTFPTLLKGIWLREGTGEVVLFHTDGTYARSDTGDVLTDPEDRGTFLLVTPEGDDELANIVMTSDGTSECAAGSTLTWDQVQWNQVPPAVDNPLGPIGAVRTIAEDDCGVSVGDQTWIHISGA